MKIVLWGLVLAAAWTITLYAVARSIGLRSTPGMWTGTVGFPGVVIANWMQAHLLHEFYRPVGYALMFVINWVFYCSVLVGIASLTRRFR